MALRPAQASRQRQILLGLLEQGGRLLQQLLTVRELLKGSVYELKTRCGKSSCHCVSPDGPLHSTTVLSWSQAGRTQLRSLDPEDRPRLRHLAADYRGFRQGRARLVKLHRQMLTAIDRLERALLVSPPKKGNRRRRS